MANVNLEIVSAGGHYHVFEKVVSGNDVLHAHTELNGKFKIVFNNKDGFFTTDNTLIEVEVDKNSGTVEIGTVSLGEKYVKRYDIHGDSAVQIPDLDAPPRIIRVAS